MDKILKSFPHSYPHIPHIISPLLWKKSLLFWYTIQYEE